jgi:hypothetical protein
MEAASEPASGLVSPKQPVVLLLFGAELEQELARPERVRHHGGDRAGDRAGGELANDLRVRIGGEAEPAIGLRDDHGEEFVALEEVPDLGRQVVALPIDVPIVEHAAELVDRPIEEGLLLGRERRGRHRQELRPIGIAAEQIGVPPDVAGFDRLALGLRQGRQHVPRPAEDRLRQLVAAK